MKQTKAFFYLYEFILKFEFITLRKSVSKNYEAILINTHAHKRIAVLFLSYILVISALKNCVV